MKDSDYNVLKLEMLICPGARRWPESNVTHWQGLRAVKDEARSRVAKAFTALDAVDADTSLSLTGKAERRRQIAESAITGLQKAEVLENCRAAVQRQMQRWSAKVNEAIKPAEDIGAVMMYAQIRDRIANIKEAPARMAFIDKHFEDVVHPLLTGPSFLSGLSDSEFNVVRAKFEQRVLGEEVYEARAQVARAMQDVERGWAMVAKAIAERGNLEKKTPVAA